MKQNIEKHNYKGVNVTRASLKETEGYNELTIKQQEFIYHYLSNGYNATAAAKMAGYSGKSASVRGWELIRNKGISAILAPHQKAIIAKYNITAPQLVDMSEKLLSECVDDKGKITDKKMYAKAIELIAKYSGNDQPQTQLNIQQNGGTIRFKFGNDLDNDKIE